MNRRLEERDRFTAIGARRLKRITDKVIEEVFGGGGGKEKKKRSLNPAECDTQRQISHRLFRAGVLYEMLTRFCLFAGICVTFFFFFFSFFITEHSRGTDIFS